jgi:hypothetical protein
MFESVVASSPEVVFASGIRTVTPTWDEIDRRLRAIAARRVGLDMEEAQWLLAARRERLHRHLGFARIEEYMERVMGYGPHAAAERLRVAEALDELPGLRDAFESGELAYSAVRELSRVVVPDTERAWLDAAGGRTVREIESMVVGRKKGDLPDTPVVPGAGRHVVRFEVSGETLALLRDARIAIADATGEQLDHDALLATLCRSVLDDGEGAEPRRARNQIALTICEVCKRGWQDGGGTSIEVGPTVIERARCDAQHVGRVDAAVPARATQDISPSVRRLVWRRDHGRCVVPGCRSARFLDVHHIEYRAEGGDHSPDNLCLLCFAHHQAEHDGRLVIRGRVSTGLTFTHRDGRAYGTPPPPSAPREPAVIDTPVIDTPVIDTPVIDTQVIDDAVSGLRNLEFTAAQARSAVAAVASHVGPNVSAEELIFAALRQMHRERSG